MPPIPMRDSPMVPPQPGMAGGMGGGDMQQMMAGGQGGYQDPGAEQAVWDMFPGTDPQVLQQFIEPAKGMGPDAMAQIMEPLTQLFAQDSAKLDAMHQEQLHAIVAELMAPDQSMAMAEPAPGIGGDGAGF